MRSRGTMIVTIALVAAAWGLLSLHEASREDPIDTAIAFLIGLGFLYALYSQVRATTVWTVRSAGLALVLAGDSTLYLSSAISRLSHDATPETLLDLTRALFIVGMPMLIAGLVALRDESES